MKYKLLLLFLLLISFIAQSQNLIFTDVNFKNHLIQKNCVDTDLNGTFDTDADFNNDNDINQDEANNVQSLLLNSFNVTDISDLKYFVNLKRLFGISLTPIAKPFDLLNNKKLEIIELAIDNSKFQLLDFPTLTSCKLIIGDKVNNVFINHNPNLKDIELNSKLFAPIKNIDTIDLSNNVLETLNIKFTWTKKNHKILDCQNNKLKSIKFSEIQVFDELNLANNQLEDQSIEGSPFLASKLYLQQNLLTNISIYNYNVPTKIIEFWGNKLITFQLFTSFDNAIENLDFSGQSVVEKIDVNTTGMITQIKMDVLGNLKELNINATEIGNDLILKETKSLANTNINAKCNVYLQDLGRFLSPNYRITTSKDIHITDKSLTNLNILYNIDYNKLYIENSAQLKTIKIEPNNDKYTDHVTVQVNPLLESFNYKFSKKLDLSINDCERLFALRVELADTLSFSYKNLNALKTLYLRSIFSTIDVTGLPGLKNATCSVSPYSKLNVSHIDNLDSLTLLGIGTGTLNLFDLPRLKYLAFNNITGGLGCNNLSFVGNIYIENFPQLKELKINNICVGDLQLSNLPLIENLKFDFLNLAPNKNTFSLLNLEALKKLELNHVIFESSQFQNLPSLETVLSKSSTFYKGISLSDLEKLKTIDVDLMVANKVVTRNLPSLTKLYFNRTYADSVEFSDLPILKKIFCNLNGYFNNIKKSKFRKLPLLTRIDFVTRSFSIDTVDVSSCPFLDSLNLDFSGSLSFLNLKNGNEKISKLSPQGYADTYKTICVDNDQEKEKIKTMLHPSSKATFENDCISSLTATENHSKKFDIFPNPTNGVINIEDREFDKIEVLNLVGQVVVFSTTNDGQLDLSSLTAGLYILKISKQNKVLGFSKILLVK